MNRFVFALATVLIALPLVSCGQSGPLYLPGNPSKIETAPITPAETEQEEDNEKEEQQDSDAS